MWLQDRLSSYDEAFARKLSVDHLLEGHEGCVNRVCWNQDGTFLASASDDRKASLRSWEWERAVTAPEPTRLTSVLFQCHHTSVRPLSCAQVCLWRFPEAESGRMMVQTEHVANIFGVRFLPGSDNRHALAQPIQSR